MQLYFSTNDWKMTPIPVLRHPDSFYQPPRVGAVVPTSGILVLCLFEVL